MAKRKLVGDERFATKTEKVLISLYCVVLAIFTLVVAICCTGCGGETIPEETSNKDVNHIIVEEIRVEEIRTETILYENVR